MTEQLSMGKEIIYTWLKIHYNHSLSADLTSAVIYTRIKTTVCHSNIEFSSVQSHSALFMLCQVITCHLKAVLII